MGKMKYQPKLEDRKDWTGLINEFGHECVGHDKDIIKRGVSYQSDIVRCPQCKKTRTIIHNHSPSFFNTKTCKECADNNMKGRMPSNLRKPMKWTDIEIKKLRRLFDEGLSIKKIVQELGISEYYISEKIKELGLKRRNIEQEKHIVGEEFETCFYMGEAGYLNKNRCIEVKCKNNECQAYGETYVIFHRDRNKSTKCPSCRLEISKINLTEGQKNRSHLGDVLQDINGHRRTYIIPKLGQINENNLGCDRGICYNDIRGQFDAGLFINGVKTSLIALELNTLIKNGEHNYNTGVKTSRGREINVDIALIEEKIAIEYDEKHWHKHKLIYDLLKSSILIKNGWKVLRIYAHDSLPTKNKLTRNINVLRNTDTKFIYLDLTQA